MNDVSLFLYKTVWYLLNNFSSDWHNSIYQILIEYILVNIWVKIWITNLDDKALKSLLFDSGTWHQAQNLIQDFSEEFSSM